MIIRLGESDLSQALDFRHRMTVDAGGDPLLAADWRELTQGYYAQGYRNDTCAHFAWQEDGRIVATAGALIRDDFPSFTFKARRYGWVMDVYVIPEYRRRGLARRLTGHALAWLREKGIVVIRLSASDEARKAGLYEQLGFSPSNEMRLRFEEAAPSAPRP
jgi:GNAT superfamily N-acetyltransferase